VSEYIDFVASNRVVTVSKLKILCNTPAIRREYSIL